MADSVIGNRLLTFSFDRNALLFLTFHLFIYSLVFFVMRKLMTFVQRMESEGVNDSPHHVFFFTTFPLLVTAPI